MWKKRSGFCLNILRLLVITSGLSCSEFGKQDTDLSTPPLDDTNQLALYGMTLAKDNSTSFLQEALVFRDQLRVSCLGLRPRRYYDKLLLV